MNNKKSLLQDSLQELENIKNESLELAKEQLINESADLLEKKSAALFEKLIAGEDAEEEEEKEEGEEEKSEKDESLNEILNELKNSEDEESDEDMESDDEEMGSEDDMESDEEEMDSDEMEDSEEGEMSLDALRKAAEEQGFKLVQADSSEEEMDSDEEEMDSDEEEMDSDEEEMDSDEEDDDIEFSDVNVDDKVLAEPNDEEEETTQKINENFKRNNTKMRNTKKQVLKDLRDVSFNKLVEAYYNMDEEDSFVVKENEMDDDMPDYSNIGQLEEMDDYEDDYIDIEDDPEFQKRMGGSKQFKPSSRELKSMKPDEDEYDPYSDVRKGGADYGDDEMDEEIMYEIDMPLDEMNDYEDDYIDIEDDPEFQKRMGGSKQYKPSSRELKSMKPDEDEYDPYSDVRKGGADYGDEEMTDEDINRMLSEMDIEEVMHDVENESGMSKLQPRKGKPVSELEEMFQEMTMEELEEMNAMLHEDGDGESMSFTNKGKDEMKIDVNAKKDYMNEQDLTEAEIEEMLASMNEEGDEEQVDEGMFDGLKSAFNQIGTSARQAVGQFSKEMTQAYNSGEVGNEIKKLETLANNLGKQVGALNSRLQKAGKQPLPSAKVIAALSNQIRSGGNISLANTQVGQGLQEEELEESSAYISQTQKSVGNRGGASREGAPERRSGMLSEEEMEMQEEIKKLKAENKALNEGFTNKVKSLENKVYDVTISALKAGFVNKFLLEHPLRENEKLQIIHRFANAQTKEQIKETYISLTNEFAKGQTVKDGSMLNESVQNKVGKVHRTDNVVVTEKNLMNENDDSNRFKQLLNYNFNKKK